jgi:phage terminase small subunit
MPARKAKPKQRKKRAPAKAKRGLTPRQQLFIREYLVDKNATRAYLRAGYKVSEKVAGTNGPRMLENATIKQALNKALHRGIKKLDITNDSVLREISKMAFGNMLDYIKIQKDGTACVDLSKLTREQAAAIHELSYEEGFESGADGVKPVKKVKFKLSDKKGSLELLGKYLKLFSDTTPVTSTQTEKLLKAVLAGTMTTREAGYKFNMLGLALPEVLKIELSKAQPEPPPPEIPLALDDKDLEAGYQRKMAEIDEEKEKWLPGRKEEIQGIKDELKGIESFGPDAEMKKVESGQEP